MPESQAYRFIKKETLTQVFSCEFGEFSENTLSYRTPTVAASILPSVSKIFERIIQKQILCHINDFLSPILWGY